MDYDKHSTLEGIHTEGTWNETLLSLFHYFICEPSLDRCSTVFLDLIGDGDAPYAWYWLTIGVKYGLSDVKIHAIKVVSESTTDANACDPRRISALRSLPPAVVSEVLDAISRMAIQGPSLLEFPSSGL